MYLSGRPLHAVTVKLAATLAEEFNGALPMSFSAGASCYNAANLLEAGMQTVTVCSDLLKTGGYLRLARLHQGGRRCLDRLRSVAGQSAALCATRSPRSGQHEVGVRDFRQQDERAARAVRLYQGTLR